MAKRLTYTVLSERVSGDGDSYQLEIAWSASSGSAGQNGRLHVDALPIGVAMGTDLDDLVAADAQAKIREHFNTPGFTITAAHIVVPPWRKPAP